MKFLRWLTGWRLIVILFVVLFVPLFRPVVALLDPVGYYAWAHSILIDGDLNSLDEFTRFGLAEVRPVTPTGYMHNPWPAGTSLIWLPLMLVAHLGVLFANWIGISIAADGYSWPYVWAASLTSSFAALAALLLTYYLARRLFNSFAAVVAVLAGWLATPLVFYQYHQPLMSHAIDVLACAVIAVLWWKAQKSGYKSSITFAIGVAIGISIWIRTQNAVFLISALLVAGYDLLPDLYRRQKTIAIGGLARTLLPLIAGTTLLLLPLLLFWREVYGSWVVNTYEAASREFFDWRAGHVLEVLWSTDRGLFVWAPITLVSLAGIPWLFRANSGLARLFAVVGLLQLYVISSWSHWSGGDAFGPRFWIVLTPFFVLCLGALICRVEEEWPGSRPVIVGLVLLFICWNFLLMLQYSLGWVAPSGKVEWGSVVENQFAVVGHGFEQIVRRLIP